MPVTINGTTGVSGVAGSASAPALIGSDADSGFYINSANEPNASVNGTAVWNAASTFGFKNRLINSGMVIDQRNAGASVTVNTGNQTFSVDRWWGQGTPSSGVFTMQQSSVAPAGFTNSLLMTVTTADASLAATDLYDISQIIEGFNVADLGWGTASAATVTLSFWVRSSVTGTFGGAFGNSAVTRSYPFTYTISAANTWEQKTITVAGDTSGTWLTNNGIGLRLYLGLGLGSTYSGTAGAWSGSFFISATGATNLMATNGATFYITGVQLEKGSTATSFDYRPYGTELQLCQRYLPAFSGSGQLGGSGNAVNGTSAYTTLAFPVPTRVAPTGIFVNSASNFNMGNAGITPDYACTSVTASNFSNTSALLLSNVASGLTGGTIITMRGGASALMYFTGCEL
jgi:hypothetical protein